jgi:hypothetical protein
MKSSNCNNKKHILILCYRNTTCLPSAVSTTKFPGALIIPALLLFPITTLPSSVACGGLRCCHGCGLWPWCPECLCVGPACLSPPHHHSAHQPPHEQLLVRLGVGSVLSSVGGVSPMDCVIRWSIIVASTHHPPHKQVLVRLEGHGSLGPWCRGPGGLWRCQ